MELLMLEIVGVLLGMEERNNASTGSEDWMRSYIA
jgi:hypothetical protein